MFGPPAGSQRANMVNALLATWGPWCCSRSGQLQQQAAPGGRRVGNPDQILRPCSSRDHSRPPKGDPEEFEEIAKEAEKRDPPWSDGLIDDSPISPSS